jgi:hypothetical protein
MTAAVARVQAWWFRPAPAERLAALRILVGGFGVVYIAAQLPLFLGYARHPARDFRPIGVSNVLDGPVPPLLHAALVVICLGLAALFTVGRFWRVVGPLYAAVLLWVLTYRNSFSMPFHTENLLVLHTIVLAASPAAAAWAWDARAPVPAASERFGWPLRLMAVVTCLTYVLAGIAKLRMAGFEWAAGEYLRDQVAYDNLRKVLLGADPSPVATPVLRHDWLFAGLAMMTLAIELGAPIALLGGRVAAVWAIAAWSFHVGVVVLMMIVFPYPLALVAYAPLFHAERPLRWLWLRIRRRFQHEQ